MPTVGRQGTPTRGGRAQPQGARTQAAGASAGSAQRGAPAGARSADDETATAGRGASRGEAQARAERAEKRHPRGRGAGCGRGDPKGRRGGTPRPDPTGATNAPRERSDRSRDRRERGEGNPRPQGGGYPSSLFGGREQAPDRPPRRGEKRSAAPSQGRKTQPAKLTKRARASGNEPTTPQGAIKPFIPDKT